MGDCMSSTNQENHTEHVHNRNTSKAKPPAIQTNTKYTAIQRQQPTPITIPKTFSSQSLRIPFSSNDCKLDECGAMSRIRYILSHNESDIACYGAYELINDHLNEYNNVRLLNDYHHLLSVHENEFEDIYNKLLRCTLNECTSYTRNHRDRSSRNNRKTYNMFLTQTDDESSDIIKAINVMQIMDTIHCYFLHSFDVLFRLNREDQNKLNKQMELMVEKETETEETIDDITVESDDNDEDETAKYNQQSSLRVRAMSQHMQEVNKSSANRRSSRFSRNDSSKYCRLERQISRHKSEIITDDEETKKDTDVTHVAYNADNDIVYSFGVRFLYDKSQKHEKWFVKAKYRSLKDELVKNEWKAFGIQEWDEMFEKAGIFAQTQEIKAVYVFEDTGDVVRGRVPQIISVEHLLAVMIYCNFDKLQTKFSESYRRLDGENAADLKRKHCEWHHLGRFLREAVEYFGKRISSEEVRIRAMLKNIVKLKFFHGINQEMVFVSTSARICGPLSTSREALVALQFAGNNGLLLELTGNNARYFECCAISDFANEKEALFVGGFDPLLIYTVINPKTIDYRKYIKAINIISSLFDGTPYFGPSKKPLSKKTIKRVYGLLLFKHEAHANQHVIEAYILKLFTHYAENVTEIVIDWKLMNMKHDKIDESIKGFKFIKNLICMKTFDWIKMNRIQILFQHLKVVQLNYIQLTKQVLDYILHILLKNKEKSLPLSTVIIYQPLQINGINIQDALAIYADSFRQKVRWFMQTKNGINLVIKKLNN